MAQYRTDTQNLDSAMKNRYEVNINANVPVLHTVPGIRTVHRSGYNSSLQNGTQEVIWGGAAAEPYLPTVASHLTVTSSSSSDTLVQVTITGLDANYNEISETVTLNGLTGVVTTNEFLRAISTIVTNGHAPVGDISIKINSNVVSFIPVGLGRGLNGSYTIPAGYTGYLIKGDTAAGKGGDAEVRMYIRPFGGGWIVGHVAQVYESQYVYDFPIPMQVPEKTDIKVTAKSSSTGTAVSCNFDIILVENP